MDTLSETVREAFGLEIAERSALQGGDLSQVYLLTLADGTRMVAKQGDRPDREARMLAAIRAADVPAPDVLGVSGDVLFLEALDRGLSGPCHWVKLGEDIARLHAAAGQAYGWTEDAAFGAVDVPNAPADDWPTFWAERRLRPHLAHLTPELAARVEKVAERLPEFLPPHPAAALLHGDLWTGNLFATPGAIYLIDPAAYYGHAEVDLAMLHLFGEPGPGFEDGYGPLEPGWRERRRAYALFPALVHLRLFGEGYRGMVERLCAGLGA